MATPTPTKPKLKISVSRTQSFSDPSASTAATPSAATAATPSDGPKKIKLKIGQRSQPPTPAETPAATPTVTQAGRQTKPTARLVESKKREQSALEVVEEVPSSARPTKKLKFLKGPKTPGIVVKSKGRPPIRHHGSGYDSEASDREEDPVIEEQIILRMMPGEASEYIKNAIKEHKIGVPRQQGGADLSIKFFDEESRRALVLVKGQPYAAVIVDLPTITETMKTWDKKTLMKSADISQMLLVFQKVKSEEEARRAPLPQPIESGFKWPHGLTPPMHDCVHRRFAKVISRKEIEDKEAEVERLLAADKAAGSVSWEWVDDRRQRSVEYEEEEEDAEGEVDDSSYFPTQGDFTTQGEGSVADGDGDGDGDGDVWDLEAQLEAELEGTVATQGDTQTPGMQMDGATPMTGDGSTPAFNGKGDAEEDLFGDRADDDDDDDGDEDVDEDEQARLDLILGVREDIADLQREVNELETRLKTEPSPMVKKRVEERVRSLKREIQLKLASINEKDEEE